MVIICLICCTNENGECFAHFKFPEVLKENTFFNFLNLQKQNLLDNYFEKFWKLLESINSFPKRFWQIILFMLNKSLKVIFLKKDLGNIFMNVTLIFVEIYKFISCVYLSHVWSLYNDRFCFYDHFWFIILCFRDSFLIDSTVWLFRLFSIKASLEFSWLLAWPSVLPDKGCPKNTRISLRTIYLLKMIKVKFEAHSYKCFVLFIPVICIMHFLQKFVARICESYSNLKWDWTEMCLALIVRNQTSQNITRL